MQEGEIKFMKVVNISKAGVFVKYSDEQNLLVPFREQLDRLYLDEEYLLRVCLDTKSGRYFASEKISNFLSEIVVNDEIKVGEELDGLAYAFTPLGIKFVLKDKYSGLIFENQVFQDIHIGDLVKVFVRNIRPDGKIDLALQKGGYKNFIEDSTQIILTKLQESGGFLAFTDKSDPEDIYRAFGISKKRFKESIGALYKKKKILIEETGIKLA